MPAALRSSGVLLVELLRRPRAFLAGVAVDSTAILYQDPSSDLRNPRAGMESHVRTMAAGLELSIALGTASESQPPSTMCVSQ